MRMLLNLLLLLAVAYLALVLLVYFAQPHLVYFPDKELSNTPKTIGLDYTAVSIATSDGETLHGWHKWRYRMPRARCCFFTATPGIFPIASIT